MGVRGPWAGAPGQLDAPYWQTPAAVVEQMLDLAKVGPGDRLIDLGCGDGRIVIAAALRGAEALGIDIDAARIAEAESAARSAGVIDRVEFRREDMFATRLESASVVALYLLPHVNLLLAPRLRAEPRPGTRILSYCFPMPDWQPDKVELVGHNQLALWIVPER